MFNRTSLLLFVFFAFILETGYLSACPFSNYKKGVYKRKELAATLPNVDTKDVFIKYKKRYEIALNELQYTYPFDLIQTRQQIQTLENYLKVCDSHYEKRAIKKTASCLKLLVEKDYKTNLEGKDRYKYFLESLRIAIENKENANWEKLEIKNAVDLVLQDIAYAHFTVNFNHTDIGYNYFWKIMPKDFAQLEPTQLNAKLLNKAINKIFPLSSPQLFLSRVNRKIHSPIFSSWDGAMATIRSKMANYQWEDRNVSLLRMSCPVYGKNYHSQIDPTFIQYLNALKSKGKKHLYISNLDTASSTHSREFKMSQSLLDLSSKPEYQNTLLFITLPLDSPFYKQGNLGLLRASYFKETFLNSMLLKQEGFYFPSSLLTKSDFISFLDEMVDQIHKGYFEEREFLERIERCQFIDIAYAHIAKYLIEQNNIDMVNWTCHHGIDRSMNTVAVFDVLLQSLSKAPIHLDSTVYLSSWPAMLYYHRHPETARIVRCYSAIQKLLEKKVETTLPKTDPSEVKDLALMN